MIINDYLLSYMEKLAVEFYGNMNITKLNQINHECLVNTSSSTLRRIRKNHFTSNFFGYRFIHLSDIPI